MSAGSIIGHSVQMTDSASDTGGAYIGYNINNFSKTGTGTTAYGIFAGTGLDFVLFAQSGRASIGHTIPAGGGSTTSHVNITTTSGDFDSSDKVFGVRTSFAGHAGDPADSDYIGFGAADPGSTGSAQRTAFKAEGTSWDTAFKSEGGVFVTEENSSAGAVLHFQAGSGSIMELYEGTISSGTLRFSVTEEGKTTISTPTDIADVALDLDQNDADQPFIYFQGTASDPAAGVTPADNITEVNGGGAVVGPQAPTGSPDTGWAFNSMVKVKAVAVGGGTVDIWVAGYVPALT
jgi:hypothetical protein